jgi:hypothetical protein
MAYIPEVTFDPTAESVQGSVNEVEFTGEASSSYGASAPVGFDTDDDLLSTDFDGDENEDLRFILIGRVSTSPIA